MNLRDLKALEIAARAKIAVHNGVWMVPSQTTSGSYRVTLGAEPSCPCDDFQLRKLPCKHIIAARLVCARDHDGKAPEIVTQAVPKKPTWVASRQPPTSDRLTRRRTSLGAVKAASIRL